MTSPPNGTDQELIDHERIWLQPKCCAGEYDGRQWCQDNVFDDGECEDGAKATEYVRADVLQSRISEVERLREALQRCAWLAEMESGQLAIDVADAARAALSQHRTTDRG